MLARASRLTKERELLRALPPQPLTVHVSLIDGQRSR